MEPRLIFTGDGSHSLFMPELNENYHSVNGALQESLHVFIEAGFRYVVNRRSGRILQVLEVGFGTGLNALLTLLEAEEASVEVVYETVEKFPLPVAIAGRLNYADLLHIPLDVFDKMHRADWNRETRLSPMFTLCKKSIDLSAYATEQRFDLIYFDAFAPDIQPELWTTDIFNKLYQVLVNGGVLVTYSSKGIVKRALRSAGFILERLPGAAGKRHMLRAVKVL